MVIFFVMFIALFFGEMIFLIQWQDKRNVEIKNGKGNSE